LECWQLERGAPPDSRKARARPHRINTTAFAQTSAVCRCPSSWRQTKVERQFLVEALALTAACHKLRHRFGQGRGPNSAQFYESSRCRQPATCVRPSLAGVLSRYPSCYPWPILGWCRSDKKGAKRLILLGGRTRTRTLDPLIKSQRTVNRQVRARVAMPRPSHSFCLRLFSTL
jgi:hypothetical protein